MDRCYQSVLSDETKYSYIGDNTFNIVNSSPYLKLMIM